MVQKYKAALVLDANAVLGEGPVWDARCGLLYWVDIVKGEIHRFDAASGRDEFCFAGRTVGSVVLRAEGGLVAALTDGFYLVPETSGIEDFRFSPLFSPRDLLAGQRFNDGKCDPAGRFWAGTMHLGQESPDCALYCLEPDGSCRNMQRDIGCSNGLAWSEDGKTLFYIDTLTHKVDAFDFDIRTGNLSGRQTVIDFDSKEAVTPGSPPAGIPDGMTIDRDGMLWIAEWKGFKVSRWNPLTGKKTGEALLPVSKVTSCAFGGKALSTLFITTAGEGLSPSEKQSQPQSGGIFCVETDTCGFEPALFKG
jgi:sugar lactone lactonase YvrE